MKQGEIGQIFIAPDYLDKCGSHEATVMVAYTKLNHLEPYKLACDIRDYLNMLEEAKAELMKNKTVASAVLQRMGNDQK